MTGKRKEERGKRKEERGKEAQKLDSDLRRNDFFIVAGTPLLRKGVRF